MPINNTIPTASWNPLAPKPAMSTFGSSQAPKAPIAPIKTFGQSKAPIKTFGQSKAPIQGTISPSNSQTSPVVSAAQSEPPQYNAVTNTGTSQGGIKGMMGTTPPPIQPYGSQQYSQQNPPAFAPIIGALANTAQQQSPKATELVGQTQAAANSKPLESGGAYDVYNQAIQRKQQFESNLADTLAANKMSGAALPYMQGRDAAIQQANASKGLALQQGITQAQQALGYGIQEQGQQISGLNQAAGQANTQQSMQQAGLGTAAGYAAPQQYSLMTAPYNPVSDTYGGGGAAGAQQRASQAGSIQAAQSNAQTQGTSQVDIAQQGLSNARQAYNSGRALFDTTEIQSQRLSDVMKGGNINLLEARWGNSRVNELRNQFGDSSYNAYITALNETKQDYTNLLSSIGAATPTVNGQQADQILEESSTPDQINAAISELKAAAAAKLGPMYELMQTYQSQLNGGGGNQGSQQGGNSITSNLGKTYTVPY